MFAIWTQLFVSPLERFQCKLPVPRNFPVEPVLMQMLLYSDLGTKGMNNITEDFFYVGTRDSFVSM